MSAHPGQPRSLCYFGAAPDTGNLGVSALCYSVLGGLRQRLGPVRWTVFDHGRGVRRVAEQVGEASLDVDRCGAVVSRRYYRSENLWLIGLCGRLGGLGNPAARRIAAADAVLDISGGDSFTDLYGPRRFAAIAGSKRLALRARRPLVLLPQTYGPFREAAARRAASEIVRGATMAWARDARSFEILRELAGSDFDPARFGCSVDVAFSLPALRPAKLAGAVPEGWLAPTAPPLVGFNVSGLIWHDSRCAAERYGFRADYRAAVLAFLGRVLRETDANVLLVPHVITPAGHYESDPEACAAVASALVEGGAPAERVAVAPPLAHPSEAKWLIGRCAWFCGTRMHATIAALSSEVPCAAIAYSDKTQGVFESCGAGDMVIDPRRAETGAVADALWDCWQRRAAGRAALQQAVPGVCATAERAFDDLASFLLAAPGASPARGAALAMQGGAS